MGHILYFDRNGLAVDAIDLHECSVCLRFFIFLIFCSADRPAGSMSAPGKRASFAAAGMNSSSLLLLGSNNKRQSFSLAGGANHNNHNNNNSSSSIYNNISTGIGAGRSGRWDSEDLGSVLGA